MEIVDTAIMLVIPGAMAAGVGNPRYNACVPLGRISRR